MSLETNIVRIKAERTGARRIRLEKRRWWFGYFVVAEEERLVEVRRFVPNAPVLRVERCWDRLNAWECIGQWFRIEGRA